MGLLASFLGLIKRTLNYNLTALIFEIRMPEF